MQWMPGIWSFTPMPTIPILFNDWTSALAKISVRILRRSKRFWRQRSFGLGLMKATLLLWFGLQIPGTLIIWGFPLPSWYAKPRFSKREALFVSTRVESSRQRDSNFFCAHVNWKL